MSEKSYYYAAGVFKLDYKTAGYPDLIKVAKEWSEDPCFHELIIRSVSEKNFGIQFIYLKEINDQNEEENPIKEYKNQLREKFGAGLYAWDYQHSEGSDIDDIKVGIIVLKPLE